MHSTPFVRPAALLCAVLVSHAILLSQAPTPPRIPVDVTRLGPQVGEAVPDFRLTDQHGKPWTLASIMGPRGAMIVFYRSADW